MIGWKRLQACFEAADELDLAKPIGAAILFGTLVTGLTRADTAIRWLQEQADADRERYVAMLVHALTEEILKALAEARGGRR